MVSLLNRVHKHVKKTCPSCGYRAMHLYGLRKCPMCVSCVRCKKSLMQCACKEKE